MSIALMSQVWEQPDLEGSELLMMLALADHANDEGVCWPSVSRLATRARLSERQAQRVLHKLADKGYIRVVVRGDGRGRTTLYILTLKGDTVSPIEPEKDDILSPIPEKRVTSRAKRVTSRAQKGDIAMSPEPLEPSLEPSMIADKPPAPSPKPKRETLAHPMTKKILDAYVGNLGYNSINYGKEGKAAAQLARDGWTVEQVLECYTIMKADKFWKDKHLSLQNIYSQIGAHFAHRSSSTTPSYSKVKAL